jgi:hypothetical protein
VGVVDEVEMVNVLVKVGYPEDGLKVAEAYEGSPEAVRLTVWVEPLTSVTVTVALTLPPCWTEPEEGLTPTVKSKTFGPKYVLVVGSLTA